MIKLQSFSKDKDFKEILKNKKFYCNYFTIYFGKNYTKTYNNLNISFVIKKKIGNAVKRNRIKRKLKAAVQKILKQDKTINLDYSYIIFGKTDAYKDKFSCIVDELNGVFKKINKTIN